MTTVPQHDAAALENERPLSVEQQQTEARLINVCLHRGVFDQRTDRPSIV